MNFSWFTGARLECDRVNHIGASDWLIIESGPNPSTDYYVKPAITRRDSSYQVWDTNSNEPPLVALGTNVVIVRYLAHHAGVWLRTNKRRLGSIVYFMDDELINSEAWVGLPTSYKKKLALNLCSLKRYLPGLVTNYWVANQRLAASNPYINATVVLPVPFDLQTYPTMKNFEANPKLVFYHATSSHIREFIWLKSIIGPVLEKNRDVFFETIGDHSINKLYRSLPRTRILHPMSWQNYIEHSRTLSGAIGLAPLLEEPFNSYRSHVKYFDICRARSIGIYSKGSPYAHLVEHANTGWIVRNSHDEWITQIENLLTRNMLA